MTRTRPACARGAHSCVLCCFPARLLTQLAEKRRRTRINDRLQQLRDLVPSAAGDGAAAANTGDFLGHLLTYITQLQALAGVQPKQPLPASNKAAGAGGGPAAVAAAAAAAAAGAGGDDPGMNGADGDDGPEGGPPQPRARASRKRKPMG